MPGPGRTDDRRIVAVTTDTQRAAEATDLLQHLIRNGCVNDGSPGSGQEERSSDVLQSYLEGSGVELEPCSEEAEEPG